MELDLPLPKPGDDTARGLGYYFDPEAPELVRQFAREFCKLPDGENYGREAEFLPYIWQNIIQPLFGWKRPDGTRRYRRAGIWTPKKHTKSSTLAILATWLCLEEYGSEVYILSSTLESTQEIWKYLNSFIGQSEALEERFWIRHDKGIIIDRGEGGGIIKILSGDSLGKSGKNASAVLFDELGEIRSREAWDNMTYAGMARRQPLHLTISTAFYEKNSVGYSEFEYAKSIIDEKHEDIHFLPYIVQVPEEFKDQPDKWWPYLPAAGVVCGKDKWIEGYNKAKLNPIDLAEFYCKMLNIWCDHVDQWISAEQWNECKTGFSEDEFLGKPCWLGLDSGYNNLNGYVLWFERDGLLYAVPRLFMPRDTAESQDDKHKTGWKAWASQGFLTLTPGNVCEAEPILDSILADAKRFKIRGAGFDGRAFELGRQALQKNGIELVSINPTAKGIGDAVLEFQKKVLNKTVRHNGNPVWLECLRNARIKKDGDGILIDGKAVEQHQRYDALSAAIAGLKMWMTKPAFKFKSFGHL